MPPLLLGPQPVAQIQIIFSVGRHKSQIICIISKVCYLGRICLNGVEDIDEDEEDGDEQSHSSRNNL